MKNQLITMFLIFILLVGLVAPVFANTINTPLDLLAEITTGTLDNLASIINKSTDYFKEIIRKFTDMGNHWADVVVGKLTEIGAIGGYEDGSFKPDSPITRAEFSKILNASLGLNKITGSAFNDTTTHWSKDNINTLVKNGIIIKNEYGSNYNPDKKITRIEIAKMIIRASGLDNEAKTKTGQNTGFKDNSYIKSSDRGYVIIAKDNKLIGGYPDNTFGPNNNATRAEASAMIVRTLEFIQEKKEEVKLPKENGVVITDKLPKETFEEKGMGEVKEKATFYNSDNELIYAPGDIVEANHSYFPFEYEGLVINEFNYVPYKDSFLAEPGGRVWGHGRDMDLFVFEATTKGKVDIYPFALFILDENDNALDRYVGAGTIDYGREDSSTNQVVLKAYPNMPIKDKDYRSFAQGKVTLMFSKFSEDIVGAKSVLLTYIDEKKGTSDVIKIPINYTRE